jgi:hypothetical protein
MRDIGKRIERLENVLQDKACVCKRIDSGCLVCWCRAECDARRS